MADKDSPLGVGLARVAEIVSSYVRHHQIAPDQVAGLIVEVHRALASLGRATRVQEAPTPVVPIRRSVQHDYVVCLECGFRAQALRRHLRVAHGLDVADYRSRWNLPIAYPLTASDYSARRSRFAKEIGLGRRATAEPSQTATQRPVTRRRGRPRKYPAAT